MAKMTTKSQTTKVVAKTSTVKTPVNKTSDNTVTNLRSTYRSIANNIYHDGYSYRVRVSIKGTKYSKNLSSKKKALAYRKELNASR